MKPPTVGYHIPSPARVLAEDHDVWIWCLAAAMAQEPTYPRFDATLRERATQAVTGTGPAWADPRTGPIRAWVFADGRIEHYVRTDDGVPVELVRFDSHLDHHLSVHFDQGKPLRVEVIAQPTQKVPVVSWTTQEFGPISFLLPPATNAEGQLRASIGQGELTASLVPYQDPRAASLQADIERALGARVIHATTTWIDGRAGVRLTLHVPDLDNPRVGEVWLLPIAKQLVVVTWNAPRGSIPFSLDTLAPGRATMALATWQDRG